MRRIPGFLFRRGYQATNALWSMYVGDVLTSPQYAVLASIYRLGPIDQISLTRAAGIDRSTLADILARLDTRGLTVRMRDESDGRRNLVSLSPGGRQLYERVTPSVEQVDAQIVSALRGEGVDQFLAQLAHVVRHAEVVVEEYRREQGGKASRVPARRSSEGATRAD